MPLLGAPDLVCANMGCEVSKSKFVSLFGGSVIEIDGYATFTGTHLSFYDCKGVLGTCIRTLNMQTMITLRDSCMSACSASDFAVGFYLTIRPGQYHQPIKVTRCSVWRCSSPNMVEGLAYGDQRVQKINISYNTCYDAPGFYIQDSQTYAPLLRYSSIVGNVGTNSVLKFIRHRNNGNMELLNIINNQGVYNFVITEDTYTFTLSKCLFTGNVNLKAYARDGTFNVANSLFYSDYFAYGANVYGYADSNLGNQLPERMDPMPMCTFEPPTNEFAYYQKLGRYVIMAFSLSFQFAVFNLDILYL